ncbi:uncharacterized protein LOC131148242 [Malania oleifera]|uniref:uncharacterized protein LOC131148242 n=1 Tax=Malania oleifera TaxID=397392 RepID=UPI0025AE311A|nr:uncharacterized protein LOC131148242 [Malania oleifera]
MKTGVWNIRGLNMPLKQNGVKDLIRKNNLDLMGILETKLSMESLEKMMNKVFLSWNQVNNFDLHEVGRISILWIPLKVKLQVHHKSEQAIHCLVKCQVTSNECLLSFIYGFNTIVARRPLWMDIIHTGSGISGPWMLARDFNCVLNNEEKKNEVQVTVYGVEDISECLTVAGLTDLKSTGSFLTWSNGRVWCNLDRVMVNQAWYLNGWLSQVHFQFPGSLSDHSVSLVSLFSDLEVGRHPFKFFNMWTVHPEFLEKVKEVWQRSDEGYRQFCFVKKLQALKKPLRSLNALHFSHISVRSEKANTELVEIQSKLHDDLTCPDLQKELYRKKDAAVRLENANRLFLTCFMSSGGRRVINCLG